MYYVIDPQHGDDNNTGIYGHPFRTSEHALQQLTPGDTLLLMPGTYSKPITIDYEIHNDGAPDFPITVAALVPYQTIFDIPKGEHILTMRGVNHWVTDGL